VDAARAAERRAWILAIAYVMLILAVSSIPGSILRVPVFRLSDKLAHAAEYAGLGLLLSAAYRKTLSPDRLRWFAPCVIATGFAIGAADELYQNTVPGRAVEFLDWVGDAVGVLLGLWLSNIFNRRKASRAGSARAA
jgi:VanZ family protein